MTLNLQLRSERLEMNIKDAVIIYEGGEPYSGEYNVIPSTYNTQTLLTAHKILGDNVTVQKIPQFLVTNTAGGKTIIIGEEYNA